MDDKLRDSVPEFFLEQEALGEYQGNRDLSGSEEQIQTLREKNKTFTEQFPAALYLRRAKEKLPAKTVRTELEPTETELIETKEESLLERFWSWLRNPFSRIGLAGALLTMVILPIIFWNTEEPYTGIKGSGDASLQVYLKTNDQPLSLEPGAALSEGDLIQVAYTARGKVYGLIASIDGRGNTFLHLSENQKGVKLIQNGAVNLPFSYELDDAPDFEHFIFYTSDQPFAYSSVESHLRRGNGLPEGIDFTKIEFIKE